jgi:hypothetical protein
MGMSDTIQPRYYGAKHAALLQQRPGALIDAVENNHRPTMLALPIQFQGSGRGIVQIVGTGTVGKVLSRAITSAMQAVVPVDADWATSAVESALDLDDYSVDPWLQWAATTKVALHLASAGSKTVPSAASRVRVKRLAAIQAVFGLPTRELAQVLDVTRQGLYKWLDASKDTKLQGASRERLALVERIGRHWSDRSAAPLGSLAREPLADGRTVLGMLAEKDIDEAAVLGAFDALLIKVQGKPKTRSQKLAEAGFKRRPSARALPADE